MANIETMEISLDDILVFFKKEMDLVEETIQHQSQSQVSLIPTISKYLTNNGGKRLRPLLLLISARLCGYSGGTKDINYSCVVEFIHAATLLHDDVVDEAEVRRGQESANLKWGNKASVLAADFLFTQSFIILAQQDNSAIVEFIAKTTKSMVEGETLQLMHRHKLNTTEHEYLDIINMKTATLLAACCRIGAILGNAPKEQENALFQFGENLGLAFQLIDDVLDYFADEEKLGKQIGNDLREGNITLPIIHVYQNADQDEKKNIETIILSEEISDEKLQEVINLMNKYKSKEFTINKAKNYIEEAKTCLNCFNAPELTNAIASVANYVIERDF